METKNLWNVYSNSQLLRLEQLIEAYKVYLDKGKTERECIKEAVEMAKGAGYRDLKDVIESGETLKTGDCVYAVCMDKTIALFQIGKEPIENGMNILGAHVDSPRIDLKQNPLYESGEFGYFDTHYYGGVKKYQWVTLPLAIHGVVVKKDGTVVDIVIGEDEKDPVVVITDLLIHLAAEQLETKAAKVIEGEKLDVLIGSKPLAGEEKEAVKANLLKMLKEQYGIEEEDFIKLTQNWTPVEVKNVKHSEYDLIFSLSNNDLTLSYGQIFLDSIEFYQLRSQEDQHIIKINYTTYKLTENQYHELKSFLNPTE